MGYETYVARDGVRDGDDGAVAERTVGTRAKAAATVSLGAAGVLSVIEA